VGSGEHLRRLGVTEKESMYEGVTAKQRMDQPWHHRPRRDESNRFFLYTIAPEMNGRAHSQHLAALLDHQ
jgi:hypothetical protein